MKIVHWNIEHGGFRSYQDRANKPAKIDQIVGVIKEVKADLVSLVDVYRWTDVFSVEELSKMFGFKESYMANFNDEGLKHFPGQLGSAVMTNLTVKKFEKIKVYDRHFLKTTIEDRGKTLEIFTVHLNHAAENKRQMETEELLKKVTKNPTLILGDFNTIDVDELERTRKVTDQPVVKIGSQVKGVRWIIEGMYPASITKMFSEAGLRDLGKGRGNTYPTFKVPLFLKEPAARLDYAFGSKDLDLKSFKVLNEKKFEGLSDHYPILVEIDV
jgi:endonuclease/exonuclease/phosphatase family metal-dependent hydrolase